MKTIKTLSALALATGIIFTSCKKTDTPAPSSSSTTPNNPSITFIPGSGYTSSDATVTVGSSVTIGYTALSNSTSNSNLAKVFVSVTYTNNIVDSTTTTFTTSITSYTNATTYTPPAAGAYRVSITVTDKAGLTANASLNITAVAPSPALMALSGGVTITLGGSVETTPSYMNLYSGATYNTSAATSNPSSIDMAYNKTKVFSPSDPLETNTTIKGAGVITKLDIYTAKAYSAITASDVNAYTPSGATNATLANGTVVMFLTNAGKKGVFQVTSFNGSATSTTTDHITIAGQVQQ